MWEDIIVSKKILGHISAGVYRSAGGALKELVSNAFDARAKRVIITTNWPSFDIISCLDNGDGMTIEDFKRIMQGGIGDSTKRVETDRINDLDRPIIGWLGIGMLGIAQVCHEFTITSHHRQSKTAFRATVKLVDFLREKIAQVEPVGEEQALEVGQFTVQPIEYEAKSDGTYIVASDMRSAFVRKFREKPGPPLPSKFSAFLQDVHKHRSVKELGDYWQMVWDLAVASPIPYVLDGPFQWTKVAASEELRNKVQVLAQELERYDFEVIVDGLSLHKPIVFPCPARRRDETPMTGRLFEIDQKSEVYGRPLDLIGYIYMQEGQAVEPFEVRGVLLRIRNVAIGNYDSTFLKYPKIEGPRFNWLSGEIYVQEGLEYALNIDRDSFNEMHPHYVRVQQVLHGVLESVFYEASQGVKERSRVKAESDRHERQQKVRRVVQLELGKGFDIRETNETEAPVSIEMQHELVQIDPNSNLWPKSRNKKDLAQIAALAFELAMQEPEQKRRDTFYRVLRELINTL